MVKKHRECAYEVRCLAVFSEQRQAASRQQTLAGSEWDEALLGG